MLSELDFESRIKQSIDFIQGCDLAGCDHASHTMPELAEFDVDEMNPEALVASNAIVSIVAGMTKTNKQVVKDSLLFSTLVANKAYPEGGVSWYKEFTKVLGICGWLSQSSSFSDYRVGNTRFTMEQTALKILESAITAAALPGPTSLLLLKVAKDTVDALQENDKPLRLFENSSKTHSGARFAIASAAESKDGEVVMAMGALDFSTDLNVTNVLFWEWSGSSVSIKRAENHLTLNRAHYERVRSTVEQRLTQNALDALIEFEI